MGKVHMGHSLPDSLLLHLHHAGLSERKVQKLVPVHVFRVNGVDIFLLLLHGLDDYHHR